MGWILITPFVFTLQVIASVLHARNVTDNSDKGYVVSGAAAGGSAAGSSTAVGNGGVTAIPPPLGPAFRVSRWSGLARS